MPIPPELPVLGPMEIGATERSTVEAFTAFRTKCSTVRFTTAFLLHGIGTAQPPGEYEILVEEELVESISRLAYHRVATLIRLPAVGIPTSKVQLVPIDPHDLEEALQQDRAGPTGISTITV